MKPASVTVWKQPCRNLTEFFGAGKALKTITPGDAESFKQWLTTQDLASATIQKRLRLARSFLAAARKHRLIDENPFAELRVPSADVSKRQSFVGRDAVARLLDIAPPAWRIIIALSRFGGLRCPSEVLSLEWRHIDWARERMTVVSPKTQHHDGKASRAVPLFADLRPFLTEAFEAAAPSQTHVVPGNLLERANQLTGWMNCNLRTQLHRLIHRAGLTPRPRAFHNLRSSCETELLERFPIHVVAGWMGHDGKILMRHSAQTTNEHFAKAAAGGAESGAHSGAAGTRTEPHRSATAAATR